MTSADRTGMTWLRQRVDVLYREVLKFGLIGAIAFVIDLGGANLLWSTVLEDKVTTAKIISGIVATLFAWVGNRSWTFRHRRARPPAAEAFWFVVVNLVALAIGVGVLAFSHYVLDFTSTLADNVATIIGIGLGTLFRFAMYRQFVFAGAPPTDAVAPRAQDLGPDFDPAGRLG